MIIKDLLYNILEEQCGSYLKEEEYTVEMLINMITKINEGDILVEAEWDVAEVIPNAGEIEIEVNGYVVFYFIIHDDYFYIKRKKGKKDIEDFIFKFKDNMFFEDITVFFDGKLQKYDYKDGKIYWID